jgi:hypothetical protein
VTRTSRTRSAIIIALASVLLIGLGGAPAAATVSWTGGSLSTVYTPTGPPTGGGVVHYYAYAPSALETGSTLRFWTCHNSQSDVIHDDIFYTKIVSGTKVVDQSVLTAGASGWDSFHVCDPSVIKVNAKIGSTTYAYALFYLGNDVNASAHNQIGVAYSNSLEGPWVKVASPIVAFPCGSTSEWGAGQPSATTINPSQGTAMLFWTQGCGSTTQTMRAQFDLDGTSGPVLVGSALAVTNSGLTNLTGGSDYLNGADLAYDPSRDRFYAVREMHPYPTTNPTYIGTSLQVVSIAGSSVWGGGGSWTVEGVIDPALTGYARNHNAGVIRADFGTLIGSSTLDMLFTTACGSCSDSLWQYALHRVNGTI